MIELCSRLLCNGPSAPSVVILEVMDILGTDVPRTDELNAAPKNATETYQSRVYRTFP